MWVAWEGNEGVDNLVWFLISHIRNQWSADDADHYDEYR